MNSTLVGAQTTRHAHDANVGNDVEVSRSQSVDESNINQTSYSPPSNLNAPVQARSPAYVDRCTETNKALQSTLTACFNANAELKGRIGLLETSLERLTADRHKEQAIHREKLTTLLKSIGECKLERDICEKDREIEVRRCVLEVEQNYIGLLNRKQIEFDRKLEELQSKLEAETMTVTKLTKQAETSFEESTALRDKLRKLQSKYTRETALYRQEANTLRSSNDTLNSAIAALKTEASNKRIETCNLKQKIRSHLDDIETEFGEKIELLTRENEELKKTNQQLNFELITCKNSRRKFPEFPSRDLDEAPSFDERVECRVSEHERFPLLVKQNEVLQEIVKTMRREREMLAQKQNEELEMAGKRVDKLENTIESLKQAVVANVEI
ncbi:hypothetical protein Trydic_g17303 [Trypoxylus dichotomus]